MEQHVPADHSASKGSSSVPPARGGKPGDNPLAHEFDFKLMMPTINVKMVNADRLADYEIWLFAATVSISACVGFLVAYAQGSQGTGGETQHAAGLLAGGVIFLVLFVAFFARAISLRRALSREAKTYSMRAQQKRQHSE